MRINFEHQTPTFSLYLFNQQMNNKTSIPIWSIFSVDSFIISNICKSFIAFPVSLLTDLEISPSTLAKTQFSLIPWISMFPHDFLHSPFHRSRHALCLLIKLTWNIRMAYSIKDEIRKEQEDFISLSTDDDDQTCIKTHWSSH